MNPKPTDNVPPSVADAKAEAKREHERTMRNARNKRWMKRKMDAEAALMAEVNQTRAELDLPAVSLRLEHKCSFKGGKRPNYDPPPALLATMSPEDLSKWRVNERKKRKAQMQRLNRLKKKEMVKNIKNELTVFSKQVEEKKKTSEVAACLLQLQSGAPILPKNSDAKGNLKSDESEVQEPKPPAERVQESLGSIKLSRKEGGDYGLKQDSPSLGSTTVSLATVSDEEEEVYRNVNTEPCIKTDELVSNKFYPHSSPLDLLASSAELLHQNSGLTTDPKDSTLPQSQFKVASLPGKAFINMGLAPNMSPTEADENTVDTYLSLVRQHQLNHAFLLQLGLQNQYLSYTAKDTAGKLCDKGDQSGSKSIRPGLGGKHDEDMSQPYILAHKYVSDNSTAYQGSPDFVHLSKKLKTVH